VREFAGKCFNLDDETGGGKAGFTPAPRLSFQPGESRKGKPLPPLADDLARRVEPGRDEVIGQAFIGRKNDPGTDYIANTVTYIFWQ